MNLMFLFKIQAVAESSYGSSGLSLINTLCLQWDGEEMCVHMCIKV